MSDELILLCTAAAFIGFFHTLIGPDHYLPFIILSKAGNWTNRKTIMITAICGTGHVIGSVLLGTIGIAAGIGIAGLEFFDDVRGSIAAYMLIAFGLVYMIWGIRYAYNDRKHQHVHIHEDGTVHGHDHSHHDEHSHFHADEKKNFTSWMLFIIFILGPCESLIPLLMYPAAEHSLLGLIIVVIIFGITTVSTMMTLTYLSVKGLNRFNLKPYEKYSHALAGFMILFSGLTIEFIGL